VARAFRATPYRRSMSTLTEIGDRADWRCWLCDEPVDPDMSVNDPRGPSIDAVTSARPKKGASAPERLAHRACNTRKGAVKAVVPWPSSLFVVDPAPIVETADRLSRKRGREVVARCPTRDDAERAGTWLQDRLSRLAPDLAVTTKVEPGGGQFLLVLATT
jgi:hypothetical protein